MNKRHTTNSLAPRKSRPSMSIENETPDFITNPYQAIVIARDSQRQREETAKKKQAEIEKLDEDMNKLKQKNEEDRILIKDLELLLIKKRRRAEKCRRLGEAQLSYKGMLEKMIRDAMHQSLIPSMSLTMKGEAVLLQMFSKWVGSINFKCPTSE